MAFPGNTWRINGASFQFPTNVTPPTVVWIMTGYVSPTR